MVSKNLHYADWCHNVPQLLEHSGDMLTVVGNRTAIQDVLGSFASSLDVSRQRNVVFWLLRIRNSGGVHVSGVSVEIIWQVSEAIPWMCLQNIRWIERSVRWNLFRREAGFSGRLRDRSKLRSKIRGKLAFYGGLGNNEYLIIRLSCLPLLLFPLPSRDGYRYQWKQFLRL
jgi:hypothetical protein